MELDKFDVIVNLIHANRVAYAIMPCVYTCVAVNWYNGRPMGRRDEIIGNIHYVLTRIQMLTGQCQKVIFSCCERSICKDWPRSL